jgi:hypothetical protein
MERVADTSYGFELELSSGCLFKIELMLLVHMFTSKGALVKLKFSGMRVGRTARGLQRGLHTCLADTLCTWPR